MDISVCNCCCVVQQSYAMETREIWGLVHLDVWTIHSTAKVHEHIKVISNPVEAQTEFTDFGH